MIKQLTKQEEKRVFNQRLQRVHISLGIGFSFLMYVALFFGIFAILLPYIQNWEKPSRHFKIADISTIEYDKMIYNVLDNPDFPKTKPIVITLPGYMKDPGLKISTQFVKTKVFDPNTLLEIENEAKTFELAKFLNYMHYGRPLGEFGWYIFGFAAVAGVILTVGGLIQILIIKYQNKGKSLTSQFSTWHRKILIWTLAPFLLIIMSGVFMNLGKKTAPLMTLNATKGEHADVSKVVYPVLLNRDTKIEQEGIEAKMLPVNELLAKAQTMAPELIFQKMKLLNWFDSTATIKFEGYNPYMPFFNGLRNNPNITLSAVDGKLVNEQKVFDRNWGAIFYDVINYIHLLFSADDFTRLFVAFIMAVTTLAIGLGNLLYLEKRARKFPIHIPVYQGLGKLSLAVMVGVIPATGLLFFLQWLLPFDMPDRNLIQKGLFVLCWAGTFTYSFYKLNSYQTAKEFLYLGGILFLLSPVIHCIKSGFSLINLWDEEIYTVLGVDIGLILLGLILLIVAKKLPIKREEIQAFWTLKGVK
ncbi:MAG: PepSY-associated TM helix domain-containing protein [Arcobacteraceae bacterium]|nr:PepSY-associated TM helix domain-containing protein [Arcobacteraceae bacterium]